MGDVTGFRTFDRDSDSDVLHMKLSNGTHIGLRRTRGEAIS